ncbi:hypothetical protein, conserved [Babesia bigemina]|uniref:C3H1-type domain-containing protein n=1 Tax=Babesia bigemina TaxID=5866 RepID=A0A061BIQ3_BABBI|nr:hypothetical protein, conserved [Babesia bigemina]CDR71364.1 hypothetical protein, conserved [Babesia bigemina]|eukprot:XP_012770314.1 hypothetical protein, conserved [Babesia bigemina]
MGFLSGVLSNIKEHLGQHKDTLNNAINILNTNKHAGKKGFNAAIGSVVEGVRGYNERVKRSNENVKTITSKLLKYVTHGGNFNRDFNGIRVDDVAGSPEVKDAQVTKVEKLVKECRQNAREFGKNIRRAHEDVADLNPQLRQNIERVKINIAHESKKLEDIHAKQQRGLEATEKIIKETLHGLNCNVNEKIKIDVEKLVADLKEKISVIVKNLDSINEKLKQCINGLTDWITKADMVVEESYKLVQEILNALKDDNSDTNPYKIKDVADKLKVEAGVLHGQFEAAKSEYDKVFTLIKGKDGDGEDKDCVMKKLNEVQSKVKEPQQLEKWKEGDWNLSLQIEKLMSKIKQNVEGYVGELVDSLKVAATAAVAMDGQTPGLNALGGTALGKIRHVGGLLETANEKHGDPTLGKNLERFFTNIQAAVSTWEGENPPASKIYIQTLQAVKEALSNKTAAVNSEFVELLIGAAITGEANLQTEIDEIVIQHLQPLNDEVEKFATFAEESKQGVIDYAQNLTKHLRALSDDIMKALTTDDEKEVNDRLRGRLNDLKQKISKDKPNITDSLQALQGRLDTLHSDVKAEPITKLRYLLNTYADHVRDKYVKQTQEQVNQQVKRAVYTITQQARKQYVSFVSDMLTLFSTKVAEELTGLPQEMDHDLVIGLHGFMHRFEYTFNPNFSGYAANPPETLHDLSSKFSHSINYFVQELKTQNNLDADVARLSSPFSAVSRLFNDLNTSHHFDHTFSQNISDLVSKLEHCAPKQFGDLSNAMLDVLKSGLHGLAGELSKAYVSVYDGASNINWEQENNPETTYCAKIFLTAFSTIYDAVHDLRINCNSLKGHQIHSTSDLGRLFLRHGFRVSESDKQHWELQNKDVINGEYVANRLSFRVTGAKDNDHLKQCESNERKSNVLFNLFDILKCILYHIDKYNEACHIAILPKPRTPCTVFEMLVWLSGLTYTSAYQALLSDGFTNVLDNPDTPLAGDGEITVFDIEKSYLEAHPQKITYKNICKVLDYLCSKSYDLLTTVVGHGDAATFYACDYSNNTLNLYYPSSGEDCLQMLLDFLRRILQPLRFLFERCSVADKNYGWADCHYGRDVPTTKSHCNIKPTDEAACLPNCQPNCKPNCQPTSPLMNYLSDSLLGYLPHRLESVGCKSKCSTCPSTSRLGMPCVTPLGFRAFSGSTKTGRQLGEMIREFLGSGVVSSLFGLSPTPPKTLPEHFGFGLSLVNKWVNVKSYLNNVGIKPVSQTKIEASIQKLSIKLYTDTGNLTNALRDAYGNSQHEHRHLNHLEVYADVSSLCMTRSCEDSYMRCAPYLSTLCSDTYQYLAHKNFATYLTWAVYLPWDFWTQLNNLCNAFKNIFCQDWGCHTCLRADKCKRGQHGLVEQKEGEPAKPHCKCPSMVQCKGVSATLYQFGFCFGNAATLNNETSAKKCSDFCSQLDRVLKSEYFKKLFTECDNFIWTIREPFTYLVLALWSLSLFYLICVMVGRLDVLHIRSHLRIPSSHKITAQSLLTTAQVGRLAKISYLQP